MERRKFWSRAAPLGFAFLLALIEFTGVVGSWNPTAGELRDAYFSAALVYALFATFYIASGLIPAAGMPRLLMLLTVHFSVAALAAVLFTSWVVRWLLGQPLNGDAARFLIGNPVASILQLRESDPVFLAVLATGLILFVYACLRVLNFSARTWSGGMMAPRAVPAAVCVLLAGLSTWRVANAELTWSSYAAVIMRHEPESSALKTYTCPLSASVPLTTPSASASKGTPVIVVVIESLRGELLKVQPDAMPFLSRLAKESLVFDKAYAPATHSDFADIALWYSRHALYSDRRLGYPENASWRGTSAFELFKTQGYRTGYFSSQDERWGDMINWMKLPALDAFFDSRNLIDPDGMTQDDAARFMALVKAEYTQSGKASDKYTLRVASDWAARNRGEPFFMGLNLQNTHAAYLIPPGATAPFQPLDSTVRDFAFSWPAERAPLVRNRYLNAVYHVDSLLEQFAQRLRDAGVWDKAIVLFVGDHGEAFREHGYASHGGPAYDDTARVFAILKMPKGSKRNGTVYSKPLSSIDFMPMLVQLSGMQEWPGFQGRSPFGGHRGSPVFMTVNGLTRENDVVQWPWKLMSRTFPERSVELFNLQDDPEERHDVSRDQPEVAGKLVDALTNWRTCQLSYYADRNAYTTLQPPRY